MDRAIRWLSVLGLVASSCVFEDIQAIEAGAPIEAVARPAGVGDGSGFGRILDGYRGTLSSDVDISRFVATAGAGSGHVVFGLWDGAGERGRDPLFDGCEDIVDCDPGTGTDVIGIPLWNGLRDCVMTSSAADRTLRVQCESDDIIVMPLGMPGTEGFGRALAALPAGSAAGVAIVGAPESSLPAEAGELWKIQSGDVAPRQLEIATDAGLGPGAELGAAVTTAPLPGGDVLVVAAALGASRVVAFRLTNDPTDMTLETLACLDGVAVRPPGTLVEAGGAIAAGDTDGDGAPEVIVGVPSANRVMVLDGTALGGAAGCASSGREDDPTTRELSCADLTAPSVETCGGFGAAVEVGDVNGDGTGDLIVGAPLSTAEGQVNAGAVYTIPGAAGGLDTSGGRGLTLAEPSAEALLGEVLTTAPSQLTTAVRDEVIVAAPGDSRLYVFWCTGVAGDAAAEGRDRCLDAP